MVAAGPAAAQAQRQIAALFAALFASPPMLAARRSRYIAPSMNARPTARLRQALLGLLLAGLASLAAGQAWSGERVLESAAKHSPRTLSQARALVQLIGQQAGQEEEQRLQALNRFFNQRVLFRDDIEVWGREDYWASPLELLDKGQGDCEDYSIAKYFSLLAAGVPQAKLRMVYVRAQFQGRSQPHMVLAYYAQPQAEPLILDNLVPEIRPASQRGDLQPVFSFNGEGLWSGVGSTSAGNPLLRLSQWRDLLAKVREEGF